MSKAQAIFECIHCGYQSQQWLGNCPQCKAWNAFMEVPTSSKARRGASTHGGGSGGTHGSAHGSGRAFSRPDAQPINVIAPDSTARISTKIGEFDRVLGGGMIAGMVVLLGGNPGIGKSTLMSQVAALSALPTLYVSSEETAAQMKVRIDRLRLQDSSFHVINTTELEDIFHALERLQSKVVIIDSIQMLYSREYTNAVGTITQLRACCQELIGWARANDAILFLVAHVTKEGMISGPKVIEHLVDTVLYFDEAQEQIRFLRASKNRFGTVQELGIFMLEEHGLVPITDPTDFLLSAPTVGPTVGVVISPVYEGSRVLPVEVQALTIPAANPRVYSDIIDPRRVSRIAAVLERHTRTPLAGHDIYLNIAGGIRVNEVAIDLAIAHALYSAATNRTPPAKTAICGEVSLAGEIKPIPHLLRRIRTARDLGYNTIIGPPRTDRKGATTPLKWIKCATVTESFAAWQ